MSSLLGADEVAVEEYRRLEGFRMLAFRFGRCSKAVFSMVDAIDVLWTDGGDTEIGNAWRRLVSCEKSTKRRDARGWHVVDLIVFLGG